MIHIKKGNHGVQMEMKQDGDEITVVCGVVIPLSKAEPALGRASNGRPERVEMRRRDRDVGEGQASVVSDGGSSGNARESPLDQFLEIHREWASRWK
jgi:hypothetical protein